MSTHFNGEGNVGSRPEYHEFPNDDDEPHRLLRLNVYFDNPTKDGFEDGGGFWASVELWHREAETLERAVPKGMRVLVDGRVVREEWQDGEDNSRVTFKVQARRVSILPCRIDRIALSTKSSEALVGGE